MKMNKNKTHYIVTFEINHDSRMHKSVDVWASSKDKAIKLAEKCIHKESNVFYYCCPSVKEVEI